MDPIAPIDLETQRSGREKCAEKVRNWKNTSNKKRKVDKSIVGQNTITAFHDSTNPPKARINQINSALVKCFVCCGIAFRIIEHSFFIDLLKELNAGYDPPTREYLSNCLLETELCNVNEKMDEDIKNQQNLTLDLSLDSHIAKYLAMQIEEIIKSVKSDHILAIVSDNIANIRKAKAIIIQKLRVSKFRKLIEESSIKDGGHKSYCVTRWTTSSELVNSVLNLKPILEKAILSLKSRSATLTDYYLNLVKLRAVLKNLPRSFHCDFHNHCYDVMNKRFEEFNDDKYLLYVPLKSGVYARLAKTVLIIGKNLGFDLEQSRALCSQLGQYRKKEFSFDLEFGYGFQEPINWWNLIETKSEPESLPIVTLYPFSICPNSASCERESMCKMITYWKSNARKEFSFFSQEMKNKPKLNEIELNKRVTEVLAETDNTDEEEDNEFEDNLSQPVRRTINSEIISHNNVVVLIESIWIENEIDLSNNLILKDIGNISKDLDDDFIDNKKNNNEDIVLTDDEIVDDTNGRGILNYNVDDLFNEYINEN
ncbi:ribonuclease H-like domain-containing protein [Rhizophagus clarus]|uniref:Ribonuclease H-like domain-containing protein n=1 Tax=Rhizophagus clarus TaxID=94130 RepID=A0A8H3LVF0_9GLOM|nr:ribonuclease H-like domain-containing protein [Rhizophagus clarus]